MTTPFPYEVAYDHFAHRIVAQGLPLDEDAESAMPPFVALVSIENGTAARVHALPISPAMMQTNALHTLITEVMAQIASYGDEPEASGYCLVMGTEAFAVFAPKGAARTVKSLQDDPNKRRALVLMVHRPEGTRMGLLPIDDARQVTYAPLLPETGTFYQVNDNPLH